MNPPLALVPDAAPSGMPVPDESWWDTRDIVTESVPVNNIFQHLQQSLLGDVLFAHWGAPSATHRFWAASEVGVFSSPYDPPLVPDFTISLDVLCDSEQIKDLHRTYFIWVMGKPPDLALEVVSNKRGGEFGRKRTEYAQRFRIPYYVVFDPERLLDQEPLTVFELSGTNYVERSDFYLPRLQLGLKLWTGTYLGTTADWVRWCDRRGRLLPTSAERNDLANQRAAEAKERAAEAKERAAEAKERADEEHKAAEAARKAADKEHKAAEAARKAADAAKKEKHEADLLVEKLREQLRAAGIDPQA